MQLEFDLLRNHIQEPCDLVNSKLLVSPLRITYKLADCICVYTRVFTPVFRKCCQACMCRVSMRDALYSLSHTLSSLVVGTWSSQLCFHDNNIQLSHQDPCSRHMLVMSILTSALCCCLQIVVSCCSHAHSVARVHV